jgi:hypothetical protein
MIKRHDSNPLHVYVATPLCKPSARAERYRLSSS